MVSKSDDILPIKPLETHQEGIPFPEQVPILPTNNPIVFPHMIAPVILEDEAMKGPIDDVLQGDRLIGLFPTLPSETDEDEQEATLFRVGTLCAVLRMLKIPDGTMRLLVHGAARIKIEEIVQQEPYPIARIKRLDEREVEDMEVEALKKQTLDTLRRAVDLANLPEDLFVAALNVEDAGKLADLVATNTNLNQEQQREILAEMNTKRRLRKVFEMLTREVQVMEIGSNISEKVRESVDKNQREFFLREQIKALQTELGEQDPHQQEMNELRLRLEQKAMPDHARETAEKELGRLAVLAPQAAEYSVIRTYLDWILDLPWEEKTDDHIDLQKAAKILDEDHYGLEKVKERILEFLAVIRLKGGDLKGPILCLVGPPGVGKTSLGRSIARATGRHFNRFSLGGMRDEAEIRGHRRTYIGAMPGRIIKALKEAGTINPLIMLDEVDKLGADFRGDPASALLEVLDPEQNDTFADHYMDMPVDLSKVMFITTANSLDTIPGPLRDRMEIIRLAGYTLEEKVEIAKRFLVPREIGNNGLKKSEISFHLAALRHMVDNYTNEAGVRSLQKQIASICRKVARLNAEQDSADEAAGKKLRKHKRIPVDADKVEEFLGPPRGYKEVAERMGRPGVAVGLAWTPVGGEILFIECTRFPGKGNLRLTGQLGDVMKESATAAMTYLRSNLDLIGVEDKEFSEYDFHLHVPAGATPKDGPSAGVGMVSVLASLVTGRRVNDYLAMTGEITLRGSVLPIGGVKEKCLAAYRAGIKDVCLPGKNKNDLEDVPEQVRKAVDFHFVDRIEELLPLALEGGSKKPSRKKGKRKK
ncbi:endopeptidase La [bacterium]|nr:endopeptidase La [bacterium]